MFFKTILLLFACITFPLFASNNNYIVIRGSGFALEVYNSQDQLIRTYPVGLGANGLGKTKSGDRKTPLGEYKIVWKASRFWETEGGYPIQDNLAFCTPDSDFTTDQAKADPDEKLWTDSYGGDQAVVMCLNYPNVLDLSKGYTGSCILIHATLLGGIGEFCSAGCIRMTPHDARELYNMVDTNSKVYICQ